MRDEKLLDDAAFQYRKSPDKGLLEGVLQSLRKVIKAKSSYIYYRKWFNLNGLKFNLHKSKLVSIEDVYQDLVLFIISKLNSYDTSRPFSNYLFSSIWNWMPSFINKEFYMRLLERVSPDSSQHLYDINLGEKPPNQTNLEDLLTHVSVEEERCLVKEIYSQTDLTLGEVAKRLGWSYKKVTYHMGNLRNNNELKKYLTK